MPITAAKVLRGMSTVAVSIRQLKAAREMLAWSAGDLAMHSGVSLPTIQRLEAKGGDLGGYTKTRDKIIAALEREGIEFVGDYGVHVNPKGRRK